MAVIFQSKKWLIMFSMLFCSVMQVMAQSTGPAQVSNKDIATQYVNDIVNNQKLYLLKYVYDTGYVFHNLDGKDSYSMRDSSLLSSLYNTFTTFPDLHYTIINSVAEGELVALNLSVTGTQRADYMGIKATQKTVNYKEMLMFRFLNNKIVEGWGLSNIADLKAQLSKP
ncbi:MAG: ester cyclase [Ginsengibacter sp.]